MKQARNPSAPKKRETKKHERKAFRNETDLQEVGEEDAPLGRDSNGRMLSPSCRKVSENSYSRRTRRKSLLQMERLQDISRGRYQDRWDFQDLF